MVRAKNSIASVHLTERDLALFKKLSAAGWLTTTQIRDYFFPQKTTNAVCKRLRKLVEGKYVALARTSSTETGLYRLAGLGKLALIEHTECDEGDIAIPTQLPRALKHFVAVNNLRLHFEKLNDSNGSQLLFFLSERELCRRYQDHKAALHPMLALFKTYRIIPDAIARVRIVQRSKVQEMDLAVEYDAGTEHANFFGRTKIRQYGALFIRHYEQLGDFKVLTFVERTGRIVSLMRQTVQHQAPRHLFYFALTEKLSQSRWLEEAIFLDPNDYFVCVRRRDHAVVVEQELDPVCLPKHALITLPAISPCNVSPREEREVQITP